MNEIHDDKGTQSTEQPVTSVCEVCAGPLASDGEQVWCKDGCQDPS